MDTKQSTKFSKKQCNIIPSVQRNKDILHSSSWSAQRECTWAESTAKWRMINEQAKYTMHLLFPPFVLWLVFLMVLNGSYWSATFLLSASSEATFLTDTDMYETSCWVPLQRLHPQQTCVWEQVVRAATVEKQFVAIKLACRSSWWFHQYPRFSNLKEEGGQWNAKIFEYRRKWRHEIRNIP